MHFIDSVTSIQKEEKSELETQPKESIGDEIEDEHQVEEIQETERESEEYETPEKDRQTKIQLEEEE